MEKQDTKVRAWIELDMENLRHNTALLSSMLPAGCALMPAVKANAYGHGAVPIAKELNKLGVQAFCVASVLEGAELRQAGISGVILVLGYTHPTQFPLLRRYELTQTVIDYEYAKLLNSGDTVTDVHVAVDTGMHRIGERCENFDRILAIFRMENLHVSGIFTHLCADDGEQAAERAFTLRQAEAFQSVVKRLRAYGYRPKAHILGSYGLLNYPSFGGAYARVGIAIYGVLSSAEDRLLCRADLRPVLSLKARVSSIREVHAGEPVGYGLAYTAEQDMQIASLAIGFADGLPRALSCGVGSVLFNGRRAPIVGRVCMDQTMVDVRGIQSIRAGDTAVIIGSSGAQSITACDIAAQTGTISNEILSRLGQRLERICVWRKQFARVPKSACMPLPKSR